MIIVYYGGALGNKMFEYAAAYSLKKMYPEQDVVFFDTLKNVVWYEAVGLDKIFNISLPIKEASSKEYFDISGRIAPPNILKKIKCDRRKLTDIWYKIDFCINKNADKRKKGNTLMRGFYYFPIDDLNIKENYFIDGHFINVKYFMNYKEDIWKEFTFKHQYQKKKVEQFEKTNSVAVHVRRGDHVKVSKEKRIYNCDLCDMEYYLKAIQEVNNRVQEAEFYFFSDDIDFVKENFKNIHRKHVIRANKDYLDMQLMSLCKHMIMANSTFSFWAAFLNRNPEKVIVCPKYYEIRNGKPIEVTYPDDWITLEVGL